MKIVDEPQQLRGALADEDRGAFFEGLGEQQRSAVLEAICGGLDAAQLPIALVSAQLMVLSQTRPCRNLLEEDGFYSVEGALEPEVCSAIRTCIQTGTEHQMPVKIFDRTWELRIVPVEQCALLLFQSTHPQRVGVTMTAAHLRNSASRLMMQADRMKREGNAADGAMLYREALRILRQADHAQLLFGAPEPMQWTVCSVQTLMEDIEQQLTQLDVRACVVPVQDNWYFRVDRGLLTAAVMTLVSNSLRHGGADVHVNIYAKRERDRLLLCVDDDGRGITPHALERMNDTWRQDDAQVGGWGLGVPYARRVAALHGGMLVFLQREGGGCAARLYVPLADEDDWDLEAEAGYSVAATAPASAAAIELSDALEDAQLYGV